MLGDEEKKAIHDLKILRQGIGLLNCIPNIEKDEVDIEAIDTILNLIEKQSKEIEELKQDEDFYREQDRMYEYEGKLNLLQSLLEKE